MRKLLTLPFFFLFYNLAAQTDTLLQNNTQEDLLESFAQDQEEEASFDYNDLSDRLEYLRRRPLDLNKAKAADLDDFPFLSALQKQAFLDYRFRAGDLISIYELQAVPGFDLPAIRQLLPFVKVKQPGFLDDPGAIFEKEHKSQLLLRWSRTLEKKQGFEGEGSSSGRYLGDPNRLFLRYRFTRADQLSYGLTAEKDAGEEFFRGSNRRGFDFYSAHFFVRNPTEKINAIALGDYAVSMGQGLLIYQGFAPGKSALTTIVSRSGRQLRPYTSVNEVDFFRGAAVGFSPGKNLDVLVFASTRRRDANLGDPQPDQEPDEPALNFVTSLQTSGLHRTASEIADENAIRQTSAGGSVRFQKRQWHVAMNSLIEHLDKPLLRDSQVYNRYYFNGRQLFNLSLDYAWNLRNLYLFGETARSGNGAFAFLHSLILPIDRKVALVLLHRHFPKDFQALNPNPFAETSGANNERGVYFGLQTQFNKKWHFNAYYDLWKHPWARFRADRPSMGSEWLVRLTFVLKRRMEAYVQLRNEGKEENATASTAKLDRLVPKQNFQARLQLSFRVGGGFEWRSRFDAGFTEEEGRKSKGMAMYQELIFRSISSPLTLSTRFAIFDTDGYATRFYAYERDVLNDFSIPAYYGSGTRFYLNTGYRLSRQWRLEVRYARSFFPDQKAIGSGTEEVTGPSKSDVKFQVRWEF
jgi:hypothetical protein